VLRAGTDRNVVADRALLQCEVRWDSDAICRSLDEAARRSLEGAAAMHGVEVDVQVAGETIGAHSDPELVARLGTVARRWRPPASSGQPPLEGDEAATFFTRRVQESGGHALYFLLGGGAPSGHRSSHFDFDERALPPGPRCWRAWAPTDWAGGGPSRSESFFTRTGSASRPPARERAIDSETSAGTSPHSGRLAQFFAKRSRTRCT
jgi:metal-dependent amidase/aminoacylase/carboxypeptidase family protein